MVVLELNSLIAGLGTHPFPRIAALLASQTPAEGLPPLDLTIGEPQFPPPAWLPDALTRAAKDWGRYPPNAGPEAFRRSVAGWLERRFALSSGTVALDAVVPTAGAREAIYQIGFLRRPTEATPLFAMPTPHYAPYRAAALMAGFTPLYLPATAEHGYLPDLDTLESQADRIAVMFLCTPSNPEGAEATPQYLARAVDLARQHGFLLVVDECYSEIYRQSTPPVGTLRVALERRDDDDPLRNVLVVNTLSKRSSAAGLRVGFVAGDRRFVKGLVDLRAYAGGTTPLPNLTAAAELLDDEAHVLDLRARYQCNYAVADDILAGQPGFRSPAAGMFLWIGVTDAEQAALHAWRTGALRVVPGSYLGPAGWDDKHPAAQHIRVALVHPAEQVAQALERLLPTLHAWGRDPLDVGHARVEEVA